VPTFTEAFEQIPVKYRKKILVRIDGAGATHELLEHLHQFNTGWRTVRFTVGWTITDVDEDAIVALPAESWTDSLHQDGTATAAAGVAELTGLNARAATWLSGLRLIVPDQTRRPAQGQTHRPGTSHGMALRHRGHQHHPDMGCRRFPPSTVDRRVASIARHCRGPGAHKQGHGSA